MLLASRLLACELQCSMHVKMCNDLSSVLIVKGKLTCPRRVLWCTGAYQCKDNSEEGPNV